MHLSPMGNLVALHPVSWQRMANGIESVKIRLERAVAALANSSVADRLQTILDDPEG